MGNRHRFLDDDQVSNKECFCRIKDHEEEIILACAQDLHKPRFEAEITESGWLLNDIVFTARELHKWAKDEKASDIDLFSKLMSPKIRKDPLGCVLVIGLVYPSAYWYLSTRD